jgi:hypothetical protein
MSDIEKLNPRGLLGKSAIDAAGAALIFGYQLRTVKINGHKAISDAKLKEDGINLKRWDVGIVNDIVTEIWVPSPPAAAPAKTK